MKTGLIVLCFILLYAAWSFVGTFVLNIAGLPGSLIAYKSERKTDIRYIIGLILSTLGQAYVHIAIMIYIINWTRIHVDVESFTKYLIWFFCMVATVGSIQRMHQQAKLEANEHPNGYENPQIHALLFTEIISFIGFFVILFYPEISDPMWSWVNQLGFPF